MPTLGPDALVLDFSTDAVRAWQGGAAFNCWSLRYNAGVPAWELAAGNGLVLYRMSSTFVPDATNVFDVLIYDLTLQAPASITIYPFQQLPCNCPGSLQPLSRDLVLTPFAPRIFEYLLEPTAPPLALEPLDPTIRISCDWYDAPSLTLELLSGDCPCFEGFYTLDFVGAGGGSVTCQFDIPALTVCGVTTSLTVNLMAGGIFEVIVFSSGNFNYSGTGSFTTGPLAGTAFLTPTTCHITALLHP